jgi:uncharacterized protein with HEPN domain
MRCGCGCWNSARLPNGIPKELRDTEPDVPWGEVIGMRNWMAHRYLDTVHAYV